MLLVIGNKFKGYAVDLNKNKVTHEYNRDGDLFFISDFGKKSFVFSDDFMFSANIDEVNDCLVFNEIYQDILESFKVRLSIAFPILTISYNQSLKSDDWGYLSFSDSLCLIFYKGSPLCLLSGDFTEEKFMSDLRYYLSRFSVLKVYDSKRFLLLS